MKKSLLYWIPTGLLLLVMMGSGVSYFLNAEETAKIFNDLGYPTYTMYFNAVAKILGGLALLIPAVPRFLKEWAYAGYLYIMLLATQAIAMRMPPYSWVMMIAFIALWGFSYWQFRKRATA